LVDVGGKFLDIALIEFTADGVDLAKDLNFYGVHCEEIITSGL
jgi:hypothetical protein